MTYSYSHSQYCDLFPFPCHSHDSIRIPSRFVCRKDTDAKHHEIKIMQFRIQAAEQLKNTSSNVKRLLPKNTLSMSPFTKSQFGCHFCILPYRNSKLFVESACYLWWLFALPSRSFPILILTTDSMCVPFPWDSHSHGIPIPTVISNVKDLLHERLNPFNASCSKLLPFAGFSAILV